MFAFNSLFVRKDPREKRTQFARVLPFCLLSSTSPAAMSISDSEAAFEQHCNRIDPTGNLRALFRAQGLNTLSSVAFAIGTPQAPPSEGEFKQFARGVNAGVDPSLKYLAYIRRLHFEACATIMSELKAKTTADTLGDSPAKLPVAEKAARLRDLLP